jgi:uncharacterized ferritin-like protein (DUF455 family)
MELRAFAERIVFGATLADKLAAPDTLTDERPGPAVAAPAAPGRPAALRFKPAGGGPRDFPGLRRLDDARERARLLHFFANHELLATELMALVLLRFPEAPPAFRRGVARTLQDEQEHTRRYVARLRAGGLEFGDLPVSGYFWRSVASMAHPLDFVTGLSLTFEQANLDYCRHFAAAFATVGDRDTAALLDEIHRDEIVHVAHGLKWLRRWKSPGESDWDAFCRQLRFPLSPQRAKGFPLNVAGRRAAGLDEDFIARLGVFAQSKGRTPTVFWFNPFPEGHLAHGANYTPPRASARLARDLAVLPAYLARPDDVVLVPEPPSVAFRQTLAAAGLPLPEFVPVGPESGTAARVLAGRKLGRLRPWAWSPDGVPRAAALLPLVTGTAPPADPARFAALYGKDWSAAFLRAWLGELAAGERWPLLDHLCGLADVGVPVRSLPEALAAVAASRSRGHHRLVVKEALGFAGQGALRLWEPELLSAQTRWLAAAFAAGHTLVVEPWHERLADFSVQFEHGPDGLRLVGYTGLRCDLRGQFVANWAEPDFRRRPPAAVASALADLRDAAGQLHRLFDRLRERLEPALNGLGFTGALGVDAFVYRDAAGRPRVKPVVELNPRHTMGRLTLELMRHVLPGRTGEFRLLNQAGLKAAGMPDFPAYAARLAVESPVQLAGSPVPRLAAGTVCLNDPATAVNTLALFHLTGGEA